MLRILSYKGSKGQELICVSGEKLNLEQSNRSILQTDPFSVLWR